MDGGSPGRGTVDVWVTACVGFGGLLNGGRTRFVGSQQRPQPKWHEPASRRVRTTGLCGRRIKWPGQVVHRSIPSVDGTAVAGDRGPHSSPEVCCFSRGCRWKVTTRRGGSKSISCDQPSDRAARVYRARF